MTKNDSYTVVVHGIIIYIKDKRKELDKFYSKVGQTLYFFDFHRNLTNFLYYLESRIHYSRSVVFK